MIIALTSGGQTGNQLMYAANMMATSMEYNISYKNISFKAQSIFNIDDKTHKNRINYNKFLSTILEKYMYGMKKMIGKTPGIKVFLEEEEEAKKYFIESRGVKLFHCWPYLDFVSLYKHQNKVREIIKPKKIYVDEGTRIIEKLRMESNKVTIVGIHIRRKDYKDFLGGYYFFDLSVYQKRMEEVAKIINGKVIFLVFSDEKIDKTVLENKDLYKVIFSGNSAIVDLVMMSGCDYIIGPPSTFSGWASFWGGVPKHIMIDKATNITSLSKDFGIYMIDVMDNEVDETGRKIITYYQEGYKTKGDDPVKKYNV